MSGLGRRCSVLWAVLLIFTVSVVCVYFYLSSSGKDAQLLMDEIKEEIYVGAEYEHVQAYLESYDWEYSFVDEEMAFYAMMKSVDRKYAIVIADLWLRIYFDENMLVRDIEMQIIHTAP